jgi:hypothetical protein
MWHQWTGLQLSGPGGIWLECPHGGGSSRGGECGGRGTMASEEVRWSQSTYVVAVVAGAQTTRPGGNDGGQAAMMVGGRRANAWWQHPKCEVVASKCEG